MSVLAVSSPIDRRWARDRRLAAAAGALAVGAGLGLVAAALRFVDLVQVHGSPAVKVSGGLEVLASAIAIPAFGAVLVAFRSGWRDRGETLPMGVLLLAASNVASAVATWIVVAIAIADDADGNYLVGTIFLGISYTAIAVATGLAAIVLWRSRDAPSSRDSRLRWVAVVVAAGYGLASLSTAFYEAAYAPFVVFSEFTTGFVVVAVGYGIVAVAGLIAADAFVGSSRRFAADPSSLPARRERTLALAATAFAIGFVAVAVGYALIAASYSEYGGIRAVEAWVTAAAASGSVVAGVVALSGFWFFRGAGAESEMAL